MKVNVTNTQMLDDKVYFAGEVEVSDEVGKRLQEQMNAQHQAVALTGNPEAAPMTKEAEGPDVGVGEPKGSSGATGNKSNK